MNVSSISYAALLTLVAFSSLTMWSGQCLADSPPPGSGSYAEITAGRAFATFLPLEPDDVDAEHFAVNGSQLSAGFGYSWERASFRLDLGGRIQHLRLLVAGNYSLDYRDDDYRANYDYLAPLLSVNVASRTSSRVNPFAGFGVGTAILFSDRQGKPFRARHIPLYGSFEAGLLFRLVDGYEARAGLSWVPPVANLNVLTAQVGLRAPF